MDKYTKLTMRGWEKLTEATANQGRANGEYDNAVFYYEENYFETAESFASYCDIYYTYSSQAYGDAKSMFREAKKYAPTDDYSRLVELYEDASECYETIYSEMHQVCEYFTSACNSYSKSAELGGDESYWELGNSQIEEMGKHIDIHDNLVLTCNNYYSDANALLESF